MEERALGEGDLEEVAALLEICDIAVIGRADFAIDEIVADLRHPGMERVGWYDAGELVGYGWVLRVGDSNRVDLDAYVHPRLEAQVGVDLLARLERSGRQRAAEAGQGTAVFDMGSYRQDERTVGWLRARGFHVGTTFTRMRIDLTESQPSPDVSDPEARIRVRESDKSEGELRVAHALDEASFGEHYGSVSKSFEEYRHRFDEHGPGWVRLWFAEDDGEPAGWLVGTRQFEADENAGFVRTLGVLPQHRGKGLARALLRHYFDISRSEGREAAILHVDVANVTNALALYESVGMRPVLQIDAWTKEDPVTPD